jgi:hypothetical protein
MYKLKLLHSSIVIRGNAVPAEIMAVQGLDTPQSYVK